MKKAFAYFFIALASGIFTGCAAYKLNMDKEHVYVHANNHWHDSQLESINVSVHQSDTNTMPDLTLSVGSYQHTVNSNLVTLVDKSTTGLAQDIGAATALVNALEGGGVSTASSSLLNSLLNNAKIFLADGKTNEAAIAISDLQAAIGALKANSGKATDCTCTTNADGTVTCSGGACGNVVK